MRIKVKRVYDKPEKTDGFRVLADRLWPRGVSKTKAHLGLWAKELTPSTELREWFHAAPEKRHAAFKKKYRAELAKNRAAIKALLRGHPSITLVTAVKDPEHSHIGTLVAFLKKLR